MSDIVVPLNNSIELIPTMSSNTTPSGVVSASCDFSSGYEAWKAFDKKLLGTDAWQTLAGETSGWLKYDFGEKQKLIVDRYSISPRERNFINRSPRSWTFEGSNNDVDWEILDTQTNITNWNPLNYSTFPITNTNPYRYYRINISANNGGNYVAISEMQMYGRNITSRIFVYQNSNYYYLNTSNSWQILPNIPTSQDFLDYGLEEFNGATQRSFESNYGKQYRLYRWSVEISNKAYQVGTKQPELVYPKSDILLEGVQYIDGITLSATGNAKVAISFDSGLTWNVYRNNAWESIINAYDGMTTSEVNSLSSSQIEQLRNGSNTIRFQYSLSNLAEIDRIQLSVTMIGSEIIARTSDYEIDYDYDNKTIIYTFKKSGTYSVNYVNSQ